MMHKMALLSTDDWAVQPPPPSRPTFPRALKVDTWFTGTTTSAEAFGAIGDRQQALMMYRAPNTSGCRMPIRVAP